MFDGNEPNCGILTPDRPGGAEPIGTIGVIENDCGGSREGVLCARISHRGGAYHDALLRLKRLCEERSECVEMVDQLTQPARAPAVGDKGQPRQVPQIRLVEFFGERPTQFEGALR